MCAKNAHTCNMQVMCCIAWRVTARRNALCAAHCAARSALHWMADEESHEQPRRPMHALPCGCRHFHRRYAEQAAKLGREDGATPDDEERAFSVVHEVLPCNTGRLISALKRKHAQEIVLVRACSHAVCALFARCLHAVCALFARCLHAVNLPPGT